MSRWILVTRSAGELAELSGALASRGYRAVAYPVLRQVELADDSAWTDLHELPDGRTWLAVTSPRAPAALRSVACRRGVWERLRSLPVAAVGAATARACSAEGLSVELQGRTGGDSLAREILSRLADRRGAVIHACGAEHRPELEAALVRGGVAVAVLPVYAMETVPAEELPPLPDTSPAAVLVTSPRAARAYLHSLGGRALTGEHFAIGPTTAAELESLGVPARVLRRPDPSLIAEELCQTC